MRDSAELKEQIEFARAQGCKSIEIDGVKYEIGPAPLSHAPVPELKAEEIVKPLSALDDLTEEEILYYATPYYDELQRRKEAHKQKLAEEAMERSG